MAYPLTLGAITFFLAVIWGRPLIALLKQMELGKKIRIEEPDTRQIKTGTPNLIKPGIAFKWRMMFGMAENMPRTSDRRASKRAHWSGR